MKDIEFKDHEDQPTLVSNGGNHYEKEVSKVIISLKDIPTKMSQGDTMAST